MGRSKFLYASIVINLILWFAVLGALLPPDPNPTAARYTAEVGVLFAIIAQHWGYYRIRATGSTTHAG